MDEKYVFVNNAINDSIILYCQYKDLEDGVNREKFMVSVTGILSIIFGEDNILNAYYDQDEEAFVNLLTSFGYSKEDYDKFIVDFEKFYEMDFGQKDKQIQKKNKYFNLVQKHLIDMAVKKNNTKPILVEDRLKLKDLLYTATSKSFFKKTYALKTAYNPYEIDEYFKKQGLVLED